MYKPAAAIAVIGALGFFVTGAHAQGAAPTTTLAATQTPATINVPGDLSGTQTLLAPGFTSTNSTTGAYVDVILPQSYTVGAAGTYCPAVRISINGATGVAPANCFNEATPAAVAESNLPAYPIPSKKIALNLPAGVTIATGDTITATLPAGYATPTVAGPQAIRMDVTNLSTGVQSASGTVSVASAAAAVPTLSEWAMILFGTVLAGGAALYIQRRRLTT